MATNPPTLDAIALGGGVVPRDAQDVTVSSRGGTGSRCARMTNFETPLSPERVIGFYRRNLIMRGWWRDQQEQQPYVAPQDVYHRWWDRSRTGQTLEVMVLTTDGTGRWSVTLMACERAE